jgi:hypothetical protein
LNDADEEFSAAAAHDLDGPMPMPMPERRADPALAIRRTQRLRWPRHQ